MNSHSTTHIELATTSTEPVTTSTEPATTNTEPATTNTEPATSTEPATTNTEPATTNTEPVGTIPQDIGIFISINTSGTNIAGEIYTVDCSAIVTGSTDSPAITWLDPMNNPVPSQMVATGTTGSMSLLTFNPLTASHAGIYTCSVTAGYYVTEILSSAVIVKGILTY